ncbi:MAG: DUF6318 family protein [Micrococcaceae bacterium]|nr:DUF6318 family protein [Micrococcaceae bacterium]MDN5824369.1 DUF6318 family protein [Micrococcaceae bacterium]
MPLTIARKALSGFAVGAAVAIALSACSPSDGAENRSPSGTTPASSSASPSVAGKDGSAASSPTTKSASPTPIAASSDGPAKNWPVPKMPAAAKKHDLEGAAAFTEYYFDLIEYTSVTNESKPISKVSSPECQLCHASIIDPAISNKKSGGWNTGGAFKLSVSSAQKEGPNEVWVSFNYIQAGGLVYDPDKTVRTTLEKTPKPVVGSFFLGWDDGWRVNSVEFPKS